MLKPTRHRAKLNSDWSHTPQFVAWEIYMCAPSRAWGEKISFFLGHNYSDQGVEGILVFEKWQESGLRLGHALRPTPLDPSQTPKMAMCQ